MSRRIETRQEGMGKSIEARQIVSERGNGKVILSLLAGTAVFGLLCLEAEKQYYSVPHPDRYHPGYCLRGDNFTKGPVRMSIPDSGLRIVGGLSNGTGIRLSQENDGVVVSSEGPSVDLIKPGEEKSWQLPRYKSTKVPLDTAISFKYGAGDYNVRVTGGGNKDVSGISPAETYIFAGENQELKKEPVTIDPSKYQAVVTYNCSNEK